MKKSWIIMLIITIIVVGIIMGIIIYNKSGKESAKENIVENVVKEVSEKVTDECTDEWEEMNEKEKQELEANSTDEKMSPNCLIIFRKYFKECQHTINEYVDIPSKLVNKTQIDLIKEYSDWEVKQYSSTEIILYKEYDGQCNQHFILRENNGKITVYRINQNNKEEVFENTEISVDYLTETDKIQIKNGINVYGKEELNQLIENFE